MVSEISTVTDRSFCHLDPFFVLLRYIKSKISRKLNKNEEISLFYTSVPKIMIIGYAFRELWHVTDVIVIFHFGVFQKKKKKIRKRKHLEISSCYRRVLKIMIR